MRTVFIGYDPRESESCTIARFSVMRRASILINIENLSLSSLQCAGIYKRPTTRDGNQLWDDISNAPMSTEFALTRFCIPYLQTECQWSLFMDSDILCLDDVGKLFDMTDDRYAVMCVKHSVQVDRGLKKDGQIQLGYPRKYWSSVMLINHEHPGWKRITLDDVNTMEGRKLHQMGWLNDDEIGALPKRWNHLVGITRCDYKGQPSFVHFTNGGPWLPEYRETPYAGLWELEHEIYRNYHAMHPKKHVSLRKDAKAS